MPESLVHFYQQGGATLVAIIGLSIISLGVGLERVIFTWLYRQRLRVSTRRILAHLREGKRTMAQAVNASLPWHPAAPLFEMLLDERFPGAGPVRRAQARTVRGARGRLWMLASIGAIAPFVGLFGTVLGVMEAFHRIGAAGAGGFDVVSSGISQALIDTAGGILVGVEAMVLFNYLQVRVQEYSAELKEAAEEILEVAAEVGGGSPGPQG